MKIGLISTYSSSCPPLDYGGEVFYWGLANELGKMGHEVHLFAPGGSQVPEGGHLHLVRQSEKGMVNYALEDWQYNTYKDLLLEMDIVHDCSLSHIVAERLRDNHQRTNIVNTINGSVYHAKRPPFNVVTGSRWWQADALAHGLETRMVYWGVDTELYTPSEAKIDKDYYLWIARFDPDKGLDTVLDLAEYLGINVKVAGSMKFTDHAHYGNQYLERINTIPNVEYVELPLDSTHHEVKRELYRGAKAFLYPVLYNECFGLVVAESMACGTPVITSDKGAMPELVGDVGWVCKSKACYKDSIEDVEQFDEPYDPESVMKAKKFSVRHSAEKYVNIYEDILNGQSW